jgi:hypothetical protein
MNKISLRNLFSFLLSDCRFQKCQEHSGDGFREIYFQSTILIIRILEQIEVGASSTCLAFLIDPKNDQRWCMFEKAINAMLGIRIEGSGSPEELSTKMNAHIDALLAAIHEGKELPFQNFGK